MKWEIDKEKQFLTLNGYYHIAFDRLRENEHTEYNWFSHLAGKRWVDMVALLDAFVTAHDAAEIQISTRFYVNWEAAVLKKAGSITYDGIRMVYNKRFHPGEELVFTRVDEILGVDDMIDALINGEKPKRRSLT
jgi:hypothetical protein